MSSRRQSSLPRAALSVAAASRALSISNSRGLPLPGEAHDTSPHRHTLPLSPSAHSCSFHLPPSTHPHPFLSPPTPPVGGSARLRPISSSASKLARPSSPPPLLLLSSLQLSFSFVPVLLLVVVVVVAALSSPTDLALCRRLCILTTTHHNHHHCLLSSRDSSPHSPLSLRNLYNRNNNHNHNYQRRPPCPFHEQPSIPSRRTSSRLRRFVKPVTPSRRLVEIWLSRWTITSLLLRSYASDVAPNTPSFPCKKFEPFHSHRPQRQSASSTTLHWPSSPGNRFPRLAAPQRPSWINRSSMVPTSTRPMPSFASVFGEEASNTNIKDSPHGSSIGRPASSGNITHISNSSTVPFAAFHVHRDSTSTLASESEDSSPTTTISTMDSSSATEISPGPSPESPSAKIAPSSFVADFRSRRTDNGSSENSPTTFFELARPVTPAKKARNLKNLGINTASSLGNLRCTATSTLPVVAPKEKNPSAPASPSFIKPPTPPKRRPSNLSLTIQTPGTDAKPARLIIPSTPSFNRPALRHFQSSPSLPLCSPSVISTGGMRLPALRPIKTNPHGFAEVPVEIEEEDQEPNFDIPLSREDKPAAYPNGPICIYESGVYLYFEPTVEQARTFDVIVNVASEVRNPFNAALTETEKDINARRVDGPPAENVDFRSISLQAKKSLDAQNSSPTTPKATPVMETTKSTELVVDGVKVRNPEYIHMPWEHNTDIVPDLHRLVRTMDDRVREGKRILVHCQCGVSRSASLIVAYGIYKNPGISVQEAYDSVKKRSKWIGPNMNLIMQLQEFRNGLLRANDGRHNQGFGMPRRSAGLSTGISTGTSRHSPFDRDSASGSRTPRTAPLPPDTDMSMQRASTGNMMAISPGPLSAPSGVFFSPGFRRSWGSSQTNFDISPKASPTASSTPYVDPKGHLVPVLSVTHDDRSTSQATITPAINHPEPENSMDSTSPPVPNFSRQLPPRTSFVNGNIHGAIQDSFLAAPTSLGFDTIISPTTSSFPSLLSPRKSEFGIDPSWPRSDESDVNSSPPLSPRSSEFHMTGYNNTTMGDSFGLLSPRATSFEFSRSPSSAGSRLSEDFDVASPTATEFPKDPFAIRKDVVDIEITSPRATEFHMTPLLPSVENDDAFGLTSPKQFEFPSTIFDKTNMVRAETTESEFRRPSFQAILPPSTLAQPQATNGLTSLNGIAQTQPAMPLTMLSTDDVSELADRVDSLSSSPDSQSSEPEEPQTPGLPELPHLISSKVPEVSLLSTPPRHSAIRTRFSSPNLRDQRRLHKIQTEMESLLPHRIPRITQAQDDIDALLSPRAEEFTRNPFHFELRPSVDDTSPASSTETIKEDKSHAWNDPLPITPQKVAEDPRSPVQTGSSPIVRNIWDVL
ncbi:hypothetical protein B0J11DRAFT_166667 [Dendryphion nanum]|uniref:protein-tyrosine-phosphatase n=1 Tax=Dendryphion nanum TaxID=256645 RepID=A0A9P9EAI5_9PLEO|nr:hypothetical protein B0J11DRAFT_166667 [Dendryphion nanum]